nr:site-specific integrase [Actinokineospora enzanensis]
MGARTEELRVLTWLHVDLREDGDSEPPKVPHVTVWRSVRAGGDTKTRKSRRSLALPKRCVDVLKEQQERQAMARKLAGADWVETDLVFTTQVGTALDAHNVRRAFRRIVKAAKLNPKDWTPRELRHSFVSLLSDAGTPIEVISRLVGHSGSAVTERVYRHQLRPVIEDGARTMDGIFPEEPAA